MNKTIQEQYERDYSWFSKEHIEEEKVKEIENPISAPKELEGAYYGMAETFGVATTLPNNFKTITDLIERETILNETIRKLAITLAKDLIAKNLISIYPYFNPSTGESGIQATVKLVKAMESLSEQIKHF